MHQMATPILSKISAISDLLKIELPAAAGICVVAGEVMALGRLPGATTAALGFLLGFFVSGAAMTTNDYFDREVDKINHPERPLPSGRITITQLVALEAFFSISGLLVAALLGGGVLLAAAVLWVVGFLYNWRYKESGLIGNLLVSTSVASTFVVGGVASAGIANGLTWTFGAIAFMFDLAEEIVGGAMDLSGDTKRNVKSLARVYGKRNALRVSMFLFALVIAGTIVPVAAGWLGYVYLVLALIADTLIAYFAAALYRSKTPEEGRGKTRSLYLTALGLVVAFLLGSML
jgi:geranylgeranylglycerol-phosphate geranylgeranyltransferase